MAPRWWVSDDVEGNRRQLAGNRRLGDNGWRLKGNQRRLEGNPGGGWRVTDGGWRVIVSNYPSTFFVSVTDGFFFFFFFLPHGRPWMRAQSLMGLLSRTRLHCCGALAVVIQSLQVNWHPIPSASECCGVLPHCGCVLSSASVSNAMSGSDECGGVSYC